MSRSAVWMSKGRFEDANPIALWGTEGRAGKPFSVPSPNSLLIAYDQDKLPVELWRVRASGKLDEPIIEDGWTWFAETTMSELVTTSAASGVTGIAFQDVALYVLPPNGGWQGAPIQLGESQITELFDLLGWSETLRDS